VLAAEEVMAELGSKDPLTRRAYQSYMVLCVSACNVSHSPDARHGLRICNGAHAFVDMDNAQRSAWSTPRSINSLAARPRRFA
jgi:hypothetical protein